MELRTLWKVQALQLYDAILFTAVSNVNTLIDCQSVNLPILMIDMRTEGRNTIRAECYCLWSFPISLEIDFFTFRLISLFSGNLVPVAQALTRRSILYTIRRTSAVLF